MTSLRGKAILGISNDNKMLENLGNITNYSEVIKRSQARVDNDMIHLQNENDAVFYGQPNVCDYCEFPPLPAISKVNQVICNDNQISEVRSTNNSPTFCELQPVQIEHNNNVTPIPILQKSDLIGLDGPLSEDIDMSDLVSIDDNIILDLTVNKQRDKIEEQQLLKQKKPNNYYLPKLSNETPEIFSEYRCIDSQSGPQTSTPKLTSSSRFDGGELSSIIPENSFENSAEKPIQQLSDQSSKQSPKKASKIIIHSIKTIHSNKSNKRKQQNADTSKDGQSCESKKKLRQAVSLSSEEKSNTEDPSISLSKSRENLNAGQSCKSKKKQSKSVSLSNHFDGGELSSIISDKSFESSAEKLIQQLSDQSIEKSPKKASEIILNIQTIHSNKSNNRKQQNPDTSNDEQSCESKKKLRQAVSLSSQENSKTEDSSVSLSKSRENLNAGQSCKSKKKQTKTASLSSQDNSKDSSVSLSKSRDNSKAGQSTKFVNNQKKNVNSSKSQGNSKTRESRVSICHKNLKVVKSDVIQKRQKDVSLSSQENSITGESSVSLSESKKNNRAEKESKKRKNQNKNKAAISEGLETLGSENISKEKSEDNSSLSENPENVSKNSKNRSKKRRERNVKKRLQIEMKKYVMKPPCNDNCKRKCSQKFSAEDRHKIWFNFRNLSKQSQRNFISRNVKKHPKKITTKANSQRHNTLTWSLRNIRVCRTFFLNTLGFLNAQTVITILKANYKHGITDVEIQDAAPEQRGRGKPWNAMPEGYNQSVVDFIEKVKPTVSHYNLNHAPNRRYLPCGISFRDVYKIYLSHCEEQNTRSCSWAYFHAVTKQMNLSTSNPKQDLCTTCQNHKEKHDENDHTCLECDCECCKEFPNHILNKIESRKCLEKDLENEDKKIYTVDMQKAICMPKLTIKDYYFSRKLVLFNETFVSPGKNEEAYCILWHEGEAGRKAHNIASAYVHFVINNARDSKQLVFYCDNCTAQNKNRILFSAMIRLVNSSSLVATENIRFVYFEPGHTYMAADTVHACIANKFSKVKDMYDLADYTEKIKKSRKNMIIQTINHQNMRLFGDELKKTFPKGYNIQALKMVEFRRGSTSIFGKNSYNTNNFKELKVMKKNALTLDVSNDFINNVAHEESPRGISALKKKELLKLCASMPITRRVFYEDLCVNENMCDLDVVIDE